MAVLRTTTGDGTVCALEVNAEILGAHDRVVAVLNRHATARIIEVDPEVEADPTVAHLLGARISILAILILAAMRTGELSGNAVTVFAGAVFDARIVAAARGIVAERDRFKRATLPGMAFCPTATVAGVRIRALRVHVAFAARRP